ncbi:hypothetical protein Tco_1350207 [Tanacetum coccineum]
MAPLPPCEQRHLFLRYQGLEYTDVDIADFEERLEMIYSREIHRVQVVDFQGMPELMRDGLFARMVMEHCDDTEVLLDLDALGTIQFQLGGARRRLSRRQFILALGLHIGEEIESLGLARYWSESERIIPGKGDLHDYWRDILTDGDFLGPPYSYTLIRDLVLIMYYQMIAHSIAGRTRLAKHFGLLTAEILRGLTVIAPELPIIDMGELPDAMAGAPRVAQDAPIVDEGGQADPAPVHAPPPPAPARTMPHMMARLEEDVHEIRRALTE